MLGNFFFCQFLAVPTTGDRPITLVLYVFYQLGPTVVFFSPNPEPLYSQPFFLVTPYNYFPRSLASAEPPALTAPLSTMPPAIFLSQNFGEFLSPNLCSSLIFFMSPLSGFCPYSPFSPTFLSVASLRSSFFSPPTPELTFCCCFVDDLLTSPLKRRGCVTWPAGLRLVDRPFPR